MSEKANILIVGDESECKTIGDILKAEGYKVKTAQTDQRLLNKSEKHFSIWRSLVLSSLIRGASNCSTP
ncbi:MAG: hypothetical protein QME54_06610 [Actinomycetota bacterium]|nr:hypothetical protein [Actinomycetota bacterium]